MEHSPRPNRRIISIDGFLQHSPTDLSRPANSRSLPNRHHTTAQPVAKPGVDGFRPRSNSGLVNNIQSQPGTPSPSQPIGDHRHATKPASNSLARKPLHAKADVPKRKFKPNYRKIVKLSALSLSAFLILTVGWFGWKFYRSVATITNNNNPFSLFGVFDQVELKGQAEGRVNILLAGNSADDPGHGGAQLTDSIMVLSIDTKDNTAFMLSIPRDLWVYIPGMGYQKINAAGTVEDFAAEGYPSGGMGMLQKVLDDNLGIKVHYYALVNYTAFRDMVNAVDGISVNIQSSDSRGIYDPNISKVDGGPLKLDNGWQELDGQTALNLARARGESGGYGFPASDFTRTEHQRLMLMALKSKAAQINIITDPVKATRLFEAISKNVKTDFKINELQSLYHLTKDLTDSQIASYNLRELNGKQLLNSYTSPGGLSALGPADGVGNFGTIQAEIKKLISTDPIVKESANVVVLNGSGIDGMARQQGARLTNVGLNLAITADAPDSYQQTVVISNSGDKPKTTEKLKQLYGVEPTTDSVLSSTYPKADFIVVIGAN